MERTDFRQRVRMVVDWYVKQGGNVTALEKQCGVTNSTIRNYIKDDKPGRNKLLEKIAAFVPEINRDWLAYGDGEMLVKDMPREVANASEGSPYYDVDFRGGLEFVDNLSTLQPASYINMPPFNGVDYLWCNITGESMAPLIRSGSRICLKKVGSVEDIIYGEIYALVIKGSDPTELHRTVKWVVRCPDDERKVRLVPENKEPQYGTYQDFYKDNILYVYKVMFSGTVF